MILHYYINVELNNGDKIARERARFNDRMNGRELAKIARHLHMSACNSPRCKVLIESAILERAQAHTASLLLGAK